MLEALESALRSKFFSPGSPFTSALTPGDARLVVVTGANGSGKSLLRKVLAARHQDRGDRWVHISVQGRVGGGLAKVAVYGDDSEESTGVVTAKAVLKALAQPRDRPYALYLDEPELGCSEELAAGIGAMVRAMVSEWGPEAVVYCATHSRVLARELAFASPTHVSLAPRPQDPPSLHQWLDRPVTPMSPEEIAALSASTRSARCEVDRLIETRTPPSTQNPAAPPPH